MKINEIIRTKRIEKGITQQQAALYLGVTAPAVNKWEKGISYPDITLLPAVARLLGTDLNTLLSFKEELTTIEINNFLNEITAVATGQGIEKAFQLSMDKIQEYPSCDMLILNTALTLEGLISFMDTGNNDYSSYLEATEELYLRASTGKTPSVINQAKHMLFCKYRARGEYEKAEKILEELPDKDTFPDKEILKAGLYTVQEKYSPALQILERQILLNINNIHSYLLSLIDIALKNGNTDDARILASKAKQAADTFGLSTYTAHVADFYVALAQKDTVNCVSALKEMLPALKKKWIPSHSMLYKHIPKKENSVNNNISIEEMALKKIISELQNPDNDEYSFMRESQELKELLDSI